MTTYSPASLAELSGCLQQAHRDRLTVRVLGPADRGGAEDGVDVALSLAALDARIEHVPGDLIATIPAGLTLGAANALLRRERQWLPLDPPGADQMTIGALVATNACGPGRHRYGTPRDLIIGVELALSDGRLVKAGGRVVKNVAGYDLARMMCGSYGSLAIVTSATFKLYPVPAASRAVVIDVNDLPRLTNIIQLIVTAPLTPAAVELASPPHRLLVRFETTMAAADKQARSLAALCEHAGATASVLSDAAEQALWDEYEHGIWNGIGTLVRVSVLPSRVAAAVAKVFDASTSAGIGCRLGGRAALGLVHARLDGPQSAVDAVCETIRLLASSEGGSAVVRSSSTRNGNWGDVGDAWPLMQAVKARFDPFHLLNPGRGPGGL